MSERIDWGSHVCRNGKVMPFTGVLCNMCHAVDSADEIARIERVIDAEIEAGRIRPVGPSAPPTVETWVKP